MINENGSVAARAFQLPLNISRSAKQLASSRVLNHLTLLGFQDKDRSFDPSGADVPLTEKQTETLEALAKFWSKAYTREVQGVPGLLWEKRSPPAMPSATLLSRTRDLRRN